MSTLQPDLVWASVLRSLSKSMSPSTFSTFVKPLSIDTIEMVGEDRAIVRFQADSPYVAQQAELRCYAQLKQAVDESTKKMCDLVFESTAKAPTEVPPPSPSTSQTSAPQPTPLSESLHNSSF